MVLIPLIRVTAKAAVVVSAIYASHNAGVWGNAVEGSQAAEKIKKTAEDVLSKTGTPIKSKLIPELEMAKVSLPNPSNLTEEAASSWNSVVSSTVDSLQQTPELAWSSMKTIGRWVRIGTLGEDKS